MAEKTQARKIIEARRISYANLPSGYMDETELLLWSQDLAERKARESKKEKPKR